jgi:aspartate 1-decarboxylase
MILNINEDYRISTDALNIMLEKKRIIKEGTTSKVLKAGDEVFDIIGFYGEFEHAYMALVKHGLLSSDLEGLRAVMNRKIIDELQAEVDRLKKKEGKA